MWKADDPITSSGEIASGGEVFGEVDEMELASQLLEVTSDAELDQFIGRLIGRASQSLDQFARNNAGRAIAGILKQTA
jgi:hypothetical protein